MKKIEIGIYYPNGDCSLSRKEEQIHYYKKNGIICSEQYGKIHTINRNYHTVKEHNDIMLETIKNYRKQEYAGYPLGTTFPYFVYH